MVSFTKNSLKNISVIHSKCLDAIRLDLDRLSRNRGSLVVWILFLVVDVQQKKTSVTAKGLKTSLFRSVKRYPLSFHKINKHLQGYVGVSV